MTIDFNNIENLLNDCHTNEAINLLEQYINSNPKDNLDTAFYLLGNAHRKMNNWKLAINNYHKAIEINPNSPAAAALDNANEILNFFNHDLFNP